MGTSQYRAIPFDPARDPDAEATIIDPSKISPSLRALVRSETACHPDSTRVGELVPGVSAPPAVLMTAHLPSDLDFSDLLDEDAAAEAPAPRAANDHTPPAVRAYVSAARERPAPPAPSTDFERPDHDWLVDPVSMSRVRAVSALRSLAVVPVAIDDDEEEALTHTFCRPAPEPPTTQQSAVFDPDASLAGFAGAPPRKDATARGMGPQRYIPTQVGPHPRGRPVSEELPLHAISRRPPGLMMWILAGAAVLIAVLSQVM